MSRPIRWHCSRYLVPTVVGAVAVVLIGSQFSGYRLSDRQVSRAGARPDHEHVGDGRIVLHSHSVAHYEFGILLAV